MSAGYSMSVVAIDGHSEVITSWHGILVPDVQPLIDLIRHHGLVLGGTSYRFSGSSMGEGEMVLVMEEDGTL